MSGYDRKLKKRKQQMENQNTFTKEQLTENFNELKMGDFSKSSIGTVKNKINEAFKGLPTYNQPISDEFTVIRARELDETKEDITNPDTFKEPPIMYTAQGRANLIGYPVFYATTDSKIAMQDAYDVLNGHPTRSTSGHPLREYFL